MQRSGRCSPSSTRTAVQRAHPRARATHSPTIVSAYGRRAARASASSHFANQPPCRLRGGVTTGGATQRRARRGAPPDGLANGSIHCRVVHHDEPPNETVHPRELAAQLPVHVECVNLRASPTNGELPWSYTEAPRHHAHTRAHSEAPRHHAHTRAHSQRACPSPPGAPGGHSPQ